MANDQKEGEAKKKVKLHTALKRKKQDEKKCFNNRVRKSQIHTARVALTKTTDPEEKKVILNKIYSLVDKAVKTGIYKINKASRIKSRLSKKLSA